jgi:hypothetical protein
MTASLGVSQLNVGSSVEFCTRGCEKAALLFSRQLTRVKVWTVNQRATA